MIKVNKPTKKQLTANAAKMKKAAEKLKERIKNRENEAK